jgi:hypothetical protein
MGPLFGDCPKPDGAQRWRNRVFAGRGASTASEDVVQLSGDMGHGRLGHRLVRGRHGGLCERGDDEAITIAVLDDCHLVPEVEHRAAPSRDLLGRHSLEERVGCRVVAEGDRQVDEVSERHVCLVLKTTQAR